MPKRTNRLNSIEHHSTQLEQLKTLQPNATPVKYHALSDRLVDVAIGSLELVKALEVSQPLDFAAFYELVDSLEDTLKSGAAKE